MASANAPVATAPHEQILNIVMGFWQSRALAVAAELELADQLAEGAVAVDSLASRTRTDASSLFRLMRALESIGIFKQVSPKVFTNTPAVTASYDWSQFPVIADIGGGIGTQLVDILNTHPSCRGILFDQPEVVAGAIGHNRVTTSGGDFFRSIPAGADVYTLRWIIHDWADAEAASILKNVRQAMKPGALLILIEEVVPEPPLPTFGMWLDPHMLVMHRGRERTITEYRELYEQAGFVLEQVVQTPSPHSLIVGRPKAD
jgi:hypothetical protein